MLLAIFSIAGLVGSMIGGALTDKFGRKGIVLFGLVFSALSSVLMGLVNELSHFYLLAIVVGSLSNVAGPAHQAMVADIPELAKLLFALNRLRLEIVCGHDASGTVRLAGKAQQQEHKVAILERRCRVPSFCRAPRSRLRA